MSRDDFTKPTIDIISKRAAYRCSNTGCQRPTQGPNSTDGVASIGVAAHICAASQGGPRFSEEQSGEARKDSSNGIWLCQSCSRLIDSDPGSYSTELLQEWKAIRELSAALELRGFEVVKSRSFIAMEKKLFKLTNEMREDLSESPYVREFFCIGRKMTWGGNDVPMFSYYLEDHDHLLSQLQIMENYGAITNSQINKVPRYRLSEDFVDYLVPLPSGYGLN